MNIGMILDNQFPPDPRVENEATTLIKAGHSVSLFCLNFNGQQTQDTIRGIEVVYTPFSQFIFNKFSPLAFTVPFYFTILKRPLQKFLNNRQLDAIHIHDMVIAKLVFKLNNNKLPVILDLHENRPAIMSSYTHVNNGLGRLFINLKKWEKYQQDFIQKADKVIVVTDEAKNSILAQKLKSENDIIILPNTVDLDTFSSYPNDTKVIEKYKSDFVILYLGATNLRRGTDTLLYSAKYLINEIPNIKFLFVGKSREDNALSGIVSNLGLNKYVEFAGWQDISLFPSYILASNICVSPLIKNEHHDTTYANKLFQYMTMGKPLVVSDAGAQANLVKNNNCGKVHLASDPKDLALQILYLYKNPDVAARMGANGKDSVIKEYNWGNTSKSLIQLYNNLNRI